MPPFGPCFPNSVVVRGTSSKLPAPFAPIILSRPHMISKGVQTRAWFDFNARQQRRKKPAADSVQLESPASFLASAENTPNKRFSLYDVTSNFSCKLGVCIVVTRQQLEPAIATRSQQQLVRVAHPSDFRPSLQLLPHSPPSNQNP